jgi:hypothetical protein
MTRFATDARTMTEFNRILRGAPPAARQFIDDVPHEEQFPLLAGCMRGRKGSSPAESDNNNTVVARHTSCLLTKMRALAESGAERIMKNAENAHKSPSHGSNLTPHVREKLVSAEKFVDDNIDSSKVAYFPNDPTIANVKAHTQRTP